MEANLSLDFYYNLDELLPKSTIQSAGIKEKCLVLCENPQPQHLHTMVSSTISFLGRSVLLLIIASVLVAPIGCKSKKKQAEEQARAEAEARAAQVDRLKAELQSLMDTPVADFADLEDREQRLEEIKAMNVDDAGVMTMIRKVEYFLQQERDRLEKAQAEAEQEVEQEQEDQTMKATLGQAFNRIAYASSVDQANSEIDRALRMFSGEDAPVFIIIGVFDGEPDYDEPTTIGRYLNYLKDQKKNPNRIAKIETDASGRITLLELSKGE